MAGSVAQRLLSLPTFAFSVFIFYWSLPIFATVHWIRFLKLSGPRNDVLDWTKSLMRFFGVTVLKQGTLSLYRGSRCMYLCNHRSWADFFVDAFVLEGRSAFLSRWLVFFVFPVFCTSCNILRAILLFKRGPVKDKEVFNQWLDRTFGKSMVPGLAVYPEGHRSLLPHSLPLKRGMLHYAYGRKLPVQIVMTSGKEGVLSEKTMSVHFGRTLVVQYSRVLKPEDYKDFEAFFSDLSSVWDSTWKEVNSASTAGLPRLDLTDAHAYDYPAPVKAKQLAVTLASIVILAAVLYGMVKGTTAVLLASGPAQPFIVALLVLWVGASFVTSFL